MKSNDPTNDDEPPETHSVPTPVRFDVASHVWDPANRNVTPTGTSTAADVVPPRDRYNVSAPASDTEPSLSKTTSNVADNAAPNDTDPDDVFQNRADPDQKSADAPSWVIDNAPEFTHSPL